MAKRGKKVGKKRKGGTKVLPLMGKTLHKRSRRKKA